MSLFTLGETHDENDINGDETEQVSHNHAIDHDYERPHFLKPSLLKKHV